MEAAAANQKLKRKTKLQAAKPLIDLLTAPRSVAYVDDRPWKSTSGTQRCLLNNAKIETYVSLTLHEFVASCTR